MKHIKLFEQFVDEMSHKDVHFKDIMQMYLKGGSFTKKKVASVVCKNPSATQKQIEDALEDADYNEIIEFEHELGIHEAIVNEESGKMKQIRTGKPENVYYVFYKGKFDVDYSSMGPRPVQQYYKNEFKVRKPKGSEFDFNPDFKVVSKTQYEKYPEDYKELKPFVDKFWDELGVKESTVNESWEAKDGKVLSNGKLIGYYNFDSDSDSFWVDDFKGKGQKSFEEKSEVIAYFKKHEKEALKALQNFKEVDESIVNEESSKKDLELQRIKLLNQAFKAMPNSPKQLKIKEEIQKIESRIKELSEGVGTEVGDSNTLQPNPGESEESFKIRTFSATVDDYEKFVTGKK
jgi:hypothetical protein